MENKKGACWIAPPQHVGLQGYGIRLRRVHVGLPHPGMLVCRGMEYMGRMRVAFPPRPRLLGDSLKDKWYEQVLFAGNMFGSQR